jgi:hypothetical protein
MCTVSVPLRSTQSMQVSAFTFSSRTEILHVMKSIRILIARNAKLATASVSHSKHYTACLEKACQSTWIYTGSLSKTFYINKVSKSQPSRSYRPLYGRGLRKWTRPSHTHTPTSRQVIQASWKESRLCLGSPEVPVSRVTMNAQSTKQRVRIHSLISFTVPVTGICKPRVKTASRTKPTSEVLRFARHTQLRSFAKIYPVNPRHSGQS